jgi:putative transposase
MWTDTTRTQYARAELALPSNLTDAEWALLEPFFRCLAVWDDRANGRCGGLSRRSAYLLRGGLPWRMLPPCFPPVSTVWRWFYLWRDNGLWLSLNHALLLIGRKAIGREASPSAGVIETKYGEATAKA